VGFLPEKKKKKKKKKKRKIENLLRQVILGKKDWKKGKHHAFQKERALGCWRCVTNERSNSLEGKGMKINWGQYGGGNETKEPKMLGGILHSRQKEKERSAAR